MARRKVKLAFIDHDGARRSALKKRRRGLIKKVEQLSVLCDVECCLVIYTPGEEVATWPSTLEEARRVALRFKGVPDYEREKKMVDHVAFLQQRLALFKETLRRKHRENREMELRTMMFNAMWSPATIDQIIPEDAIALVVLVDSKLQELNDKREEMMRSLGTEVQPQSGMDPADPLGMVLGRPESAERRNNIDNMVVVPAAPLPLPLPPPPHSAAAVDHPNPLELMLQQTMGMETRSNAVGGVGAPSPSDEMLLYLNNPSTISPWNENMFSF
ncbi:agamous-like MADS-box protein AGL80 [Zingiber officinale]|uniref:agamous-like MADS-box protein AGL80 n=1 Tax=Zingiber officinale TaxID=94328 RepID=UPI001C4C1A6B|nr:agamous-like MADS-box protein AGL80 [Zingiber officinale]